MGPGIVTAMATGKATTLVLLLGIVPLLGCGSAPEAEPDTKAEWLPDVQGAPIELGTSPEMLEIAQLEFERSTGNGRLMELLTHADPGLRKRAALALGRLPHSDSEPALGNDVTAALCRGLEDPDPEVRLAAAFSLGVRSDPRSLGVLEAYRNDGDPRLRARVVEAASWIPEEKTHQDLLLALRDSDLRVRIEAAVATARWDAEAPTAGDVDRALLDTLRPYAISPGRTTRTAVEAELVWRILYALSRRGADLGRGAFLEYADSDIPLERLFALRGLSRIDGDAEAVDAAARALIGESVSNDWRVAYEATIALGHFADPAGMPALAAAVEHRSIHVRAGAMQALGNFEQTEKTQKLLNRGLVDLSPTVRSAALASLVKILPADESIERLKTFARHDEVPIRLGAALAAATLEDPRAAEVLRNLAVDPNLLVATRAIEGLGNHMSPETRAFLHRVLGNRDNGIRLAAVLALRQAPDSSDAEVLIGAFETSEGDVSAEVDFNVLENLGQIGAPTSARWPGAYSPRTSASRSRSSRRHHRTRRTSGRCPSRAASSPTGSSIRSWRSRPARVTWSSSCSRPKHPFTSTISSSSPGAASTTGSSSTASCPTSSSRAVTIAATATGPDPGAESRSRTSSVRASTRRARWACPATRTSTPAEASSSSRTVRRRTSTGATRSSVSYAPGARSWTASKGATGSSACGFCADSGFR